jgi:hypothetical protein
MSDLEAERDAYKALCKGGFNPISGLEEVGLERRLSDAQAQVEQLRKELRQIVAGGPDTATDGSEQRRRAEAAEQKFAETLKGACETEAKRWKLWRELEDLKALHHSEPAVLANALTAAVAQNRKFKASLLRAFILLEWVVGEGISHPTEDEDPDGLFLELVDLLGIETADAARVVLMELEQLEAAA